MQEWGTHFTVHLFPLLQRLVCLLVTPRSTLRPWKKREMVSRMLRRLAGVGQRSLRANERQRKRPLGTRCMHRWGLTNLNVPWVTIEGC